MIRLILKNTHFKEHKVGVDDSKNEFVRLKYRRQYHGEIQCSSCAIDLSVGYYWLNVGNCAPYCTKCVEGGKRIV